MNVGPDLLVDVLEGLYIGGLTAVVPALVAWALGFTFKYFTGVTIPGFGVLVFGVAIAGIQGGLLGLLDPQFVASPTALVSALVVMMATLYAHAQGDRMGTEFPRRFTVRGLRERGLSAEAVERAGRFGRARVRTTGEVGDVEGYPPLSEDLRAAIRDGEWTFPADLPLSELERRLEDRLRTEHDLAEATASIDDRGRATVSAAPPVGALSRRVPPGERAVSVDALVPTGLARGDEVTATPIRDGAVAGTGDGSAGTAPEGVEGTVLSARSGADAPTPAVAVRPADPPTGGDGATAGPDPATPAPGAAARTAARTTGGDGRVTVAVARSDAETLLETDAANVVVRARGTRREFELLSLLRRHGNRMRRVEVAAGSALDGTTLGEAALRRTHGVAVLAVRRGGEWTVAPRGPTRVAAGDALYVVGSRESLDRVEDETRAEGGER
ncbi:potassium channel family protein [Halorussus halobius]|uniref:potassium channel family protein n=1 Tax=Halorussus halobius TaxID=1710537 RepID=UPI001091BD9F|nr:TrkA C-terminal domain-containing protein [Halorussus halobius]